MPRILMGIACSLHWYGCDVHKMLAAKPLRKEPFEDVSYRRENNIKMGLTICQAKSLHLLKKDSALNN
jgi:hypothetical protein